MKNSVSKKKFFLLAVIIFSIFLIPSKSFAGVMVRPRIMHVVSTKYFDFMFSEHSSKTAQILADKADDFYEEANRHLNVKKVERLPVVISPDSERIDVKYSDTPFANITVYEGVADFSDGEYRQALYSKFRYEVYLAVSEKSKVLAVAKNLPFSFVQGFAYLEEQINHAPGAAQKSQNYAMILAQAKLDGQFPSWFQACAYRDIYPENKVTLAAAAGFSGYLIDQYGFEKYLEFWNAAGKLNLFKLTAGIFKDVYGIPLAEAWNAFEEIIPLPAALEVLQSRETLTSEVFEDDNEDGLYKFAVNTAYGVAWYDEFRKEISFCREFSIFRFRNILMWAENVTNMTVSPDGRFLVISYTGSGFRNNFKKDYASIYDLKRRVLLLENYELRDGQVVTLPDGKLGIAGIYVKDKIPELRVYKSEILNKLSFNDKTAKTELVYSKVFSELSNVANPVPASEPGELYFLLKNRTAVYLGKINLSDDSERFWKFNNSTVNNLRIYDFEKNQLCYSFSVYNSFIRFGLLNIDADSESIITDLRLSKDLPGGVNYPFIRGEDVYYCAQKFSHGELRRIPRKELSFELGAIYSATLSNLNFEGTKYSEINFDYIRGLEQEKYNLFKNQYKGVFLPFSPIFSFDLLDGIKYWPGLGFAVHTESDIFGTNEFGFSASSVYLPLEFTAFMWNLTREEQLEYVTQIPQLEENFSFAGYIKNGSLPVDILAGTILKFNNSGSWNWQSLLDVKWQLHSRQPMHFLNLDFELSHLAGTSYYDSMQSQNYPDLAGWASYFDAYKTVQFSVSMEYTNIHQYGYSSFEKSGLSIGATFYTLWDIMKIEKILDDRKLLPKADRPEFNLIDLISQLNGFYYATVHIPAITPLRNHNGWILAMPTELHIDVLNRTGKAMDAYGEFLIFGKEIQNGFRPLFFNRVGLKFGYDFSLVYNADNVAIPDLRSINSIYDIFMNTYDSQNIYLKLDLDFVPVIGKLSSWQIITETRFSYYPKTKGFLVTFGAEVKM